MSEDEMRAVSRAGPGLLKFVNAVMSYCDVLKEVRPKREKVAQLEKDFYAVSNQLYISPRNCVLDTVLYLTYLTLALAGYFP